MAGFDIDRVAMLARLELTDEERTRFGGQLETIVAYVDRIAGLELDGLEATLHGHDAGGLAEEGAEELDGGIVEGGGQEALVAQVDGVLYLRF